MFFSWYNTARHHGGVGLMTPAIVHGGEVEAVTAARKLTLSAAFEARPERFVRRTPRPPVVPEAARINKSKTNSSRSEACALAENTLIPGV
jgi:putative transposase